MLPPITKAIDVYHNLTAETRTIKSEKQQAELIAFSYLRRRRNNNPKPDLIPNTLFGSVSLSVRDWGEPQALGAGGAKSVMHEITRNSTAGRLGAADRETLLGILEA
jgi:hypothetical protein